MIGQSEIIVGAKIQALPAIHHQPGALGAADGANTVEQTGLL
jgi:hypothetical protein